ncbi:MAG TPA: hypothetical protein PKH07_03815 [bacterium]|nr:hypothetical protein [bacterium]
MNLTFDRRIGSRGSLFVLIFVLVAQSSLCQAEILGSCYRKDEPFPEYMPLWSEGYADRDQVDQYTYEGMPLGASLHFYYRNVTSSTVQVSDVLIGGISLLEAIQYSEDKARKHAQPASIEFSKLSEDQKKQIKASGEPIWWKVEPRSIKAGATAEITVRLRKRPLQESVALTLVTDKGKEEATIAVADTIGPRVHGVSFSDDRRRLFLYLRHPNGGVTPPNALYVDGEDVTGRTTLGQDNSYAIVPVEILLDNPFERASFHCARAEYQDGSSAWAGFRVWDDELAFGIWGARPGAQEAVDIAKAYLQDIAQHNINVQMEMVGSEAVSAFLKSDEGRQEMQRLGIRRMIADYGKGNTQNPYAYFLVDEPDAGDYTVESLDIRSRVGALAQSLVRKGEQLRESDPATPNLVNVNSTFKPENWYVYGQVPDIFATDPYYQARLLEVFWRRPERYPLFGKATIIEAVSKISHSACAPKTLHLVLNAVSHRNKQGRVFRFGTPEEKRIETYYALSAGAKGFSYWWYTPGGQSHGCGAQEPEAVALWREIGLLGAEIRTLGSLIQGGCPVDLPLTSPNNLSVNGIMATNRALVLICINENYFNDRLGTIYSPVRDAVVSLTLPIWLNAREVFEVSFEGTKDVSFADQQEVLKLQLGTVNVTKLVVVTSDLKLRTKLQEYYVTHLKDNVASLLK